MSGHESRIMSSEDTTEGKDRGPVERRQKLAIHHRKRGFLVESTGQVGEENEEAYKAQIEGTDKRDPLKFLKKEEVTDYRKHFQKNETQTEKTYFANNLRGIVIYHIKNGKSDEHIIKILNEKRATFAEEQAKLSESQEGGSSSAQQPPEQPMRVATVQGSGPISLTALKRQMRQQ